MKKEDLKIGLEFRYIGKGKTTWYTKNKIYKIDCLDVGSFFNMEDDIDGGHGWSLGVDFDRNFQLASEPREYTSSKEDIADAIRDFVKDETVEFREGSDWIKGRLTNFDVFDMDKTKEGEEVCTYESDGGFWYEYIRKLQKPAEPVNPYAELEEKGKFKVVEAFLDDKVWRLQYTVINSEAWVMSMWVNHKDFAGYVFTDQGKNEPYVRNECFYINTGNHAVAVRFKVGE